MEPVPLAPAIRSGARNVLVILTKPRGREAGIPGLRQQKVIRKLAELRGHSPGVIKCLWDQHLKMYQTLRLIRGRSERPENVNIFTVQPAASFVDRLTTDQHKLERASGFGRLDMEHALLSTGVRRYPKI